MQATFFDNQAIQGFHIREKRQFVLPAAAGKASAQPALYVAAILADIAQLGFTFDGKATAVLKQLDTDTLARVRAALVTQLKATVGANVKYRPLFRSFPDDIPHDIEFLFQKLVNYLDPVWRRPENGLTVLSCGHIINGNVFDVDDFGACPICQRAAPELSADKPNLLPLSEITPLKVLSAASTEDVLKTFANVASARTSLSDSYKEFAREVIAVNLEGAVANLPAEMPFKENMALVIGMLLKSGSAPDALLPYVKTATDALRIAVALSGGDLSLADACKFKLTNGERRFILRAMEKLPHPQGQMQGEMVAYLGRWTRLGEVLHVGQYTAKYPKTAACFAVLRNNPETVVTFEGAVARLFEKSHVTKGQAEELLSLLSQRPGEFARRIDTLLQRGGLEQAVVLQRFKPLVGALATPMLLTLLAHFRTRGEAAEFRAFMPKGSVAKMQIIEGDTRHPLSLSVRSEIIAMARTELVKRFSEKPSLGKVFVDDTLDGILVPTAQRSASTSLVTVPRGSRLAFDTSKGFLRLFIHWTQTSETGNIDVDLTAGLYDENWRMCDQMSWTNMSSWGRSTHSGDVRSAPMPHGAAEFIDVDLEAVKAAGVRYVLVNVYSWTGQSFKDFPAIAGFMERDEPRRGDHFEAKTVANKFNISSDTTAVAPMAVDLETGEVIWMDMTLKAGRYGSIESQGDKMVAMAKAIDGMRHSRVSLYDLFELHTEARGTLVTSKEEADTVLDMAQLGKLDELTAHWL
jgi:hypothetical protein